MKSKVKSLNKEKLRRVRREFAELNANIIYIESALPLMKNIRSELNKESIRLMKLINKEGK